MWYQSLPPTTNFRFQDTIPAIYCILQQTCFVNSRTVCNNRIVGSHVVRFDAHARRPAKQGTNECGYSPAFVLMCGEAKFAIRRDM